MPKLIELLRLTDAPDVLAIEAASFERHGARDGGRLTAAKLDEELTRAWARLWVARADASGPACAFLLAWHVADELQILDVATHPTVRRQGFAAALVQHALAYAQDHHVRQLVLEARRSNTPALTLYRASGFFATAVRRKYYPDDEDAVEMMLVFDEAGAVVRREDEVAL